MVYIPLYPYIYHKNQPNVGKYTIHGSYGYWLLIHYIQLAGRNSWWTRVVELFNKALFEIGIVSIWVFPKIVGNIPPNHPFVHRVFHDFHHPFWATSIFGNTHIWIFQICTTSSFFFFVKKLTISTLYRKIQLSTGFGIRQISQPHRASPQNGGWTVREVSMNSNVFHVRWYKSIELYNTIYIYMDESENNGTPQSSILIGFSIPSIWGYPYFWKHPYVNLIV